MPTKLFQQSLRQADLRRVLRTSTTRVLLLCVVCCASFGALAATHPGDDAPAGVLRVLKLRHQQINHPHRDTAGEVRLIHDFAERNGLTIEWIDGVEPAVLANRLSAGEGDILIADVPPEAERAAGLLPSLSMGVYQYTVYGREDLEVSDPSGLSDLRVAVSLSSPMWPYLSMLERQLKNLQVVVLPDDSTRETVLAGIVNGSYDAAVARAGLNEDPVAAMPRLKRLFALTGSQSAVWYFAGNRPELREKVNTYLQRFHAAQVSPQPAFGDLDQIARRHLLRVITRIDPQNYFLNRGQPVGFEYELVRKFGRENGLAVEFLVAKDDAQVLDWLRKGIGDLITTRVASGRVDDDPAVQQSRTYFHSASVIVSSATGPALDPAALAGKRVAVLRDSEQQRALEQLIAGGVEVEPLVFTPGMTVDDLAASIESGAIHAAIVDAYALPNLLADHASVQAGASMPAASNYAWTTRSGDRLLHKSVNRFLSKQFRMETYNILARRYFEQPGAPAVGNLQEISPFDDLVRRHAETFNFDWRLIVAQMYLESKFNPRARSSAGAAGLMQLLPSTARSVGVSNPFDPDAGIRGGIAYLNRLRERFDSSISARERTWFALAAYNSGFQRVDRAREKAAATGRDPNRWFGNVEAVMREQARSGRGCGCGQTIAYVRAIRSLYNTYNRTQERLTAGLTEDWVAPAI